MPAPALRAEGLKIFGLERCRGGKGNVGELAIGDPGLKLVTLTGAQIMPCLSPDAG